MTAVLLAAPGSAQMSPSESELAELALRCSPRKGQVIPFGLRFTQVQQVRSASSISTLIDH